MKSFYEFLTEQDAPLPPLGQPQQGQPQQQQGQKQQDNILVYRGTQYDKEQVKIYI
jgi:hypothetical protein